MSTTETSDNKQHGQSVALIETPNGVTIIGNRPSNGNVSLNKYHPEYEQNEVQRRNLRNNVNEDDSFEYGTDRESSVYNPTTMPLRSVMAQAGGRYSQKNSEHENEQDKSELLTKGNQLGIPESRFSRWIPKDQREILEKQAKIMAERMKPKTPEPKRNTDSLVEVTATKQSPESLEAKNTTVKAAAQNNNIPTETEIYSDTESADVKATSTATTATTAAVSEVDANAPVNNESGSSDSNTNNGGNKKSKRLPSFAAIFKRINERDTSNKRKCNEQDVNNEGEGLTPTNTATTTQTNEQLATDGRTNTSTDGNDNQPKEDKQLVYAELVLKPAENDEPLPAKSSTEYAEIVYVKKDENTKKK